MSDVIEHFFGDGSLCFQATSDIDFARASARHLADLIDCTLDYLAARQLWLGPER